MEFLSKEYVNELGRNYYPNVDFSVQPYSEKFGSFNGVGQSSRFTVPASQNVLQNVYSCNASILRIPAGQALAGSVDLRNCGDLLRQFQTNSNTTQTTFGLSNFDIYPPGTYVTTLNRRYLLIPDKAIIPNIANIEFVAKGSYTFINGFNPNISSNLDSCLYVGYLATTNTNINDVVINSKEFYFGQVTIPDLTLNKGWYPRALNYFPMNETTSDNIVVFDSMFLRPNSFASFIGYRIVPSYSNNTDITYTMLAS